jgi:hypothetical protein
MKKVKLSDINILDVGNTLQLAGVIYAMQGVQYLCYLQDEEPNEAEFCQLEMDTADWEKFLRQTDLLETEVLAQAADGKTAKIILRKSARQVEQGVSWKVFKRDDYQCRYCAADDIPMTVDHLVLWEEGGPSIEANLLTACRKCNKTRGNTPYFKWLEHPFYKKVSEHLSPEVFAKNIAICATLADIPTRLHRMGR